MKREFECDPMVKMTAFVKKNKVSQSTVSRAIKEMGGNCFRRVKIPLLTDCLREKRRVRCRRLLNDLKSHGNRILIFSDEKSTFTVFNQSSPVFNKQNDHVMSILEVLLVFEPVCDSVDCHPADIEQLYYVGLAVPRVRENRYLVSYRFHLGTYAHHIKTLLITHVLDVELLIFISIIDSLAL